jgi:signal transduction histidine kinase
MSKPYRRLHRRMMAIFTGFTFGVAALFALHAVNFMYVVEDRFFNGQLAEEAGFQVQQHAATGSWSAPRSAHIRLHVQPDTFPEDLSPAYARHPQRREFPGSAGRHYHVLRFETASADVAWLVAETSAQLVVRPMRDRVLQLLAWSAAVVVALALLIAYWLARRTAAPLERLAAMVESMRPGELPDSLPGRFPHNEVGVLAHGLESLIRRVRAFVAREQEFTRDASHELRTPLAVIRSASERLAVEPGLGADARRHLEHIRDSAAQLEQTIATLLALAREDTRAGAWEPERVLPIIERVVVEQSGLIEHKPVTVDVRVPATATLAVPAPVLHILLSNLVGNAFSHSEAGEVRIDMDAGGLRIANRGHPMDAGLRSSIHEPFSRREGSAGFGLGLAIVHRLCGQHDLELEFDSNDDVTVVTVRPGRQRKNGAPGET